MQRYILKRIGEGVIAMLGIATVIFVLSRASGDPLAYLAPPEGGPALEAQLRRSLGFDKPLYVQYGIFIRNAIKGDFGISTRQRRPVIEIIFKRLPNSLILSVLSLVMSLVFGIPLGVWAAVKKDGIFDKCVQIVAGLGMAVPSFWLGLMLMNLFSLRLRLLPTSGMANWRCYLMPVFCVGMWMMAGVIRLIRSSILDALDSEYVKMARIKGVSERRVIWKHALRNSLLPVLSFSGMYIAILISAAIVVETVFAWPGFGRLAWEAIAWRDFPMMQGIALVSGVMVIAANLLTDVLYGYLDPRIRY